VAFAILGVLKVEPPHGFLHKPMIERPGHALPNECVMEQVSDRFPFRRCVLGWLLGASSLMLMPRRLVAEPSAACRDKRVAVTLASWCVLGWLAV
jgi:hypothetical protein